MVPFPTLLPQPLRDGYGAIPLLQRKRLLMDDGQYVDPRTWGKQPFKYTFNWRFDDDQLKLFEAWLEYDILRSSDGWFSLIVNGDTLSLRPTTGEPIIKQDKNTWIVSLECERITDAPVLPNATGTLPSWPEELPKLEKATYQYNHANSETSSDIETGLAEMRSRFVSKLTKFQSKIYLDKTERDLFWDFYRNQLADGIAWFLAPYNNGFGESLVRAKFGDSPPAEQPIGSWYEISISLETANAPLLTYNEYNTDKEFINDYVEDGYVEDGYVGHYV